MSILGGDGWDDYCSGCESLEKTMDKECERYEIRIQTLLEENAELKDELRELRWMMEKLEK